MGSVLYAMLRYGLMMVVVGVGYSVLLPMV